MRMGGGRRGCGRNGFRASVSPLLGPPSRPTQRRTQGGAALNGGDNPSPNHSSHLPPRSSRPRVSQQRTPPAALIGCHLRRRHFQTAGSPPPLFLPPPFSAERKRCGVVRSGPLPPVPQLDSSPWKPSPWARSPLGGEGVGSVLGPAPAARPRRTAPPVGPRPAAGRSRHPSPSFCQGLWPVVLPGCARTVKRGSPPIFLSYKGDVSSAPGEQYAYLSYKRGPVPFYLMGEIPSQRLYGTPHTL